jgi:hypothetical protein
MMNNAVTTLNSTIKEAGGNGNQHINGRNQRDGFGVLSEQSKPPCVIQRGPLATDRIFIFIRFILSI